jgi:hypothetical protein
MKNLQLAPWQVALRVRAQGSSCQSCRSVAGAMVGQQFAGRVGFFLRVEAMEGERGLVTGVSAQLPKSVFSHRPTLKLSIWFNWEFR